jgi:hypothetical protein
VAAGYAGWVMMIMVITNYNRNSVPNTNPFDLISV